MLTRAQQGSALLYENSDCQVLQTSLAIKSIGFCKVREQKLCYKIRIQSAAVLVESGQVWASVLFPLCKSDTHFIWRKSKL